MLNYRWMNQVYLMEQRCTDNLVCNENSLEIDTICSSIYENQSSKYRQYVLCVINKVASSTH